MTDIEKAQAAIELMKLEMFLDFVGINSEIVRYFMRGLAAQGCSAEVIMNAFEKAIESYREGKT